jgi:hypothetical protein
MLPAAVFMASSLRRNHFIGISLLNGKIFLHKKASTTTRLSKPKQFKNERGIKGLRNY